MANNGVLFLDELPEFSRSCLESLRTPLEEGKVTINRANFSFEYPAKFILVAAMNPCPCGYYGSLNKECKCSSKEIKKYLNKISGPLLDRIDLQVEVLSTEFKNLRMKEEENSNTIKEKINKARDFQKKRNYGKEIKNAYLANYEVDIQCKLNRECIDVLEKAFDNLNLSGRSYYKILKVARTIADLEEQENILEKHILEAIQYRILDKKYK